jgi:alkanesulfonate monooxygenase SsuD/methylene tetrahydromethanopterin reductase-like flavin-dependent oxidoreductase (luciferase family)
MQHVRCFVIMLAVGLCLTGSARAQQGEKWVVSWTASAQGPYPIGNPSAQPDQRFAFPSAEAGANDQTFRLIVRPDIWGREARLRFTNVFGTRADGGVGYLRLAENHAKRGNPGGAEIARHSIDVEWMRDRNFAFVGSPQTVIEQIKAAAREGVFNTVMAEFNIGAIAEEDLMRSIKMFGTEVIPALRGFEPY